MQIASPAALAFPRAVEHLLQTSLELRDRYERGEISEHGLSDRHGKTGSQAGPDAGNTPPEPGEPSAGASSRT